jgi:hypothetical protein
MKPELVARRFRQRDEQRLADFIEIALPVYRLTVRGIMLAHRRIPPIEEFVLRTLSIETHSPGQLSAFLGLEDRVLRPCLVGLVQTGDISASENLIAITSKGRLTIGRAESISTEERTFSIHFDALTRKLIVSRNLELVTFQDVQWRGLFEICQSPPLRPGIRDLRIPEINRLAKSQHQFGEIKRDLLAISAIESIKKLFVPAVALVYKGDIEPESQLGIAIDGKLSPEHEKALVNNPSFKKFLTTREGLDVVSAIVGIIRDEAFHDFPALDSLPTSAAAAAAAEAAILDAEEALHSCASVKEAEGLRARIEELESKLGRLQREAKQQPVRNIYVHDHPPLLQDALVNCRERLLIISPWITAEVVDTDFLKNLEALLKKGVLVHIGHGITPQTKKRPKQQDQAVKARLEALSTQYSNFRFVRLGNTHAKVLIKDQEFAAVSSFNWLSFKGDPNRTFRDEQGVMLQRLELVDAKYKEVTAQFS